MRIRTGHERNELKFARKLYFWDMGIRNGVIGNMAPVSLRSPEELGHMWEPFAFIYAYIEDEKSLKVSLHGGGWISGNTLLNYNAYILLIDAMLEKGIKVRTACQLDNDIAMRFNRSIGFIKYYSSKNYHYLWISSERLHKSKIFKRINRK